MKIAVVGVGGTGSAACRHLVGAGHEVVGYEQFAVGHTRGSSHGESRIIRYTYPDPLYTALMHDSYRLWADLEADAGEELFVRCGSLLLGPPEHPELVATRDSLADNALPYEEFVADAVAERFPSVRLKNGEVGLFQRDGGFLRATRCVRANARLARANGATLHENTAVSEVVANGDRPVVRTVDGAEEVFDGVLVTAGAWMGKLLARLGLRLRVERRQVVYLDITGDPAPFAPDRFPVWIDAESLYYGFPTDGVVPGCKLASHTLGRAADPDTDDRAPEESAVAEAVRFAADRFPGLTPRATFTQVCLYTNTDTEDFILDYVPGLPNVALVSGCSGHGFKFTVLLGRLGAELLTGGPALPHSAATAWRSRFALSRFVSDCRIE